MNKTNKQKGFTLIELMVVIAIVSLITSIITYSTSEAKTKAEDSKMIQESGQIERAIQIFKNDNGGNVPGAAIFVGGSAGDKGVMYGENTTQYEAAMQQLVTAGYYPKIPKSSSGNSYAYMVALDGQSAVFSAILKKTNTGGSGGGSPKNVCSIINSGNDAVSCDYVAPIYNAYGYGYSGYGNDMYNSCSDFEYDSNIFSCIIVDSPAIENYCKCNSQQTDAVSTNPSLFPNSLCNGRSLNRVSADTCYVYIDVPMGIFLCEKPTSSQTAPICGGGNDKDYCTCI